MRARNLHVYRGLFLEALGAFETVLAEFDKQHAQWQIDRPDPGKAAESLGKARKNALSILDRLEGADDLLSEVSHTINAASTYARQHTLYRLGRAISRLIELLQQSALRA